MQIRDRPTPRAHLDTMSQTSAPGTHIFNLSVQCSPYLVHGWDRHDVKCMCQGSVVGNCAWCYHDVGLVGWQVGVASQISQLVSCDFGWSCLQWIPPRWSHRCCPQLAGRRKNHLARHNCHNCPEHTYLISSSFHLLSIFFPSSFHLLHSWILNILAMRSWRLSPVCLIGCWTLNGTTHISILVVIFRSDASLLLSFFLLCFFLSFVRWFVLSFFLSFSLSVFLSFFLSLFMVSRFSVFLSVFLSFSLFLSSYQSILSGEHSLVHWAFPSLVHWICFGLRHEVLQINIAWQVRYFACEEGVAVKAGDCPWPALGRLPKPARLALCTCCLACTWQAWRFPPSSPPFSYYITFVWQYECKSLWLNVIILCHYPLYVSVNVPILVHMWKDVNIPPHPTPPQIACWWMWVQVIVTERHYPVPLSFVRVSERPHSGAHVKGR